MVAEYFDNYLVYDDGRIYSKLSNKFLKTDGVKNKQGYHYVTIFINNKKIKKRVHQVILQAFSPNQDKNLVVNHKNGIKTDNRLSNLEWVTISENIKHAYSLNLVPFTEKRKDALMIAGKKSLEKETWKRAVETTRKIKTKDHQKVIDWYLKNNKPTLTEVACNFNVGIDTITRILKANSIEIKRNPWGVVGLTYSKDRNKWTGVKKINGKKIGKRFKTKEEAISYIES